MTELSPHSPQERLAASRQALVRQMSRENYSTKNSGQNSDVAFSNSSKAAGIWQISKQMLLTWWQHHPVHLAADVAKPFLTQAAREKPLQLVAVAAVLGAALVISKPWRLVSVTGLVLTAFKSTRLSSVVTSLMPFAAHASRPEHSRHDASK